MVYASRALSNLRSMTVGLERDSESNLFWHWIKHAQPGLIAGKVVESAEIPGIPSEADYLRLARRISAAAASGVPGTEVKIRECQSKSGATWVEWLIWHQPPGEKLGLFLVIKVVGTHGELKTLFAPEEGKSYFDRQAGVFGN